MRRHVVILLLLLATISLQAQRFFNLTAPEVRIDSMLPVVTYAIPLSGDYADSTYSVSIVYPEFIPMSNADVQRYHSISSKPLPALPVIEQHIGISRRQASLRLSLVPLVCRDGKYQKLVSFMLKLQSAPVSKARHAARRLSPAVRYADHSVLSSGRWAKIRVPSTGVYQLSEELLRKAGFTDAARVKVYGYGGALQPEQLTADYISQTDDLHEVPVCDIGGRLLFHAVGPVTWSDANQRIRNPYSDYGYYFITEGDAPSRLDSEAFLATFYPSADDYNVLYETDDYAWFQGGSNLYDATPLLAGVSCSYDLKTPAGATKGELTAVVSADAATSVTVSANGATLGEISIPQRGSYDEMRVGSGTFDINGLTANTAITLTPARGSAVVRLDYLSLHSDVSRPAPALASESFPVPEYVGEVANQDHHADEAADMIVIIPSSRKLEAQAERIKALHEAYDGLRVRIVAADELYNEYSSGTPDANAYRRYLKMLYDRATSSAEMPRYLLLFGDAAWDNRMLTSAWRGYRPDDFLLCYESDNSYSHTDCYVTDDYFCMLDDGEGGRLLTSDQADVAVGRFPVRSAEQAAIMVDKLEAYVNNQYAGAWQNTIVMMGDDGNDNQHMKDADDVGRLIEQEHPTMQVRRIMWDAYERTTSATGHAYPDVTRLIKQQMQSGALMMNYAGHGAPATLSHERVVSIGDFEDAISTHLPLWVTASCDIMPFDGQEDNIGEAALLNRRGGAVAFYGTARTVYQSYNRTMNLSFTYHVLSTDADGSRVSVGEAVRRAKNELIGSSTDLTPNKLQYALLGDPALVLARPMLPLQIDSINGVELSADAAVQQLGAGTVVTVSGHVQHADGTLFSDFEGRMTATVYDAEEEVTCRLNDAAEADDPFVYTDRTRTLFSGTDSVSQGRFRFSFAVPRDISYADATGLINVYAVSSDRQLSACGATKRVLFGGTGHEATDHDGPSVYCYLNSSSFVNGGCVNATPYFVAELADSSGINATGNGIGHDLELVIDGQLARTYTLNDYFQYDFGSHTHGTVGFSIPALDDGAHTLQFRAWDVMNNSTTTQLDFVVDHNLSPQFFDVEATHNPAVTTTSFRILHDRQGSDLDVVLDVFDTAGRHLWQHHERGVAIDNSYTIDWDLCVDGGRRLHTGIYLYRVRISSDGSSQASQAKKIIIISNK